MKRCLLALEFSTDKGSVALFREGQVLAEVVDDQSSPSARIWSLIETLLVNSGQDWSQIGAIAYGAGPGAFTGVRLSCGLAQGLGLTLGVPLLPVSTLESLLPLITVPRVVIALDARMNQVYLAAYEQQNGNWISAVTPQLCTLDTLPDLPDHPWWGAGSGAEMWSEELATRWSPQWQSTLPHRFPRAAQIAQLAFVQWQNHQGIAASSAQPVYLRQRVALTRAERGL